MKRAALTIAGTVAGLAILLGFKTQPVAGLDTVLTPSGGDTATSGTASGSGSGSGSGSSSGSSSGSTSGSGTTSSGTATVTGQAVQTPYGAVQIKVTTSGGQITDVKILQAPWNDGQSQQISSYALPILVQETMSAQSANIDMVSGATYTSNGYVTSLQSVLDQINA